MNHSAPSPFTRLLRRYLRSALLSLVTGAFFAILWAVFALLRRWIWTRWCGLCRPRERRRGGNTGFR